MVEIVKETVAVEGGQDNKTVTTSVKKEATGLQTVEYSIYFIFGLLEVLLIFRLVLKVMGASLASAFVKLIYGFTKIFILPFEGIFSRGYTEGLETTSVLEPSTIVAIIVYAIAAWGIVKLLHVLSGEKQTV